MRKLIALLFAVALLAVSVVGVAGANNGRDNNGSHGRGDNCTSWDNNRSQTGHGANFHACSLS
jgi:hypothetical protein